MAADNRLTGEQLAALSPGDPVTIETSDDFRWPRYSTGTAVRLAGSCIVVSCRSARGVPYVHQFDRRTGVRIGGGAMAHLVAVEAGEHAKTEEHRQFARLEGAYRECARHRADVDKLRRLRDAISDCLDESLVEHH